MGKIKTNRSAAKRFKVTATGKVKYKSGYLRHMLSSKSRKRKRHLRAPAILGPTEARVVRALMPYA